VASAPVAFANRSASCGVWSRHATARAAIRTGVGTWTVLGHVNATHSGKARNHNSGILRDPYGGLIGPDAITVMFCASDIGSEWLWAYRL